VCTTGSPATVATLHDLKTQKNGWRSQDSKSSGVQAPFVPPGTDNSLDLKALPLMAKPFLLPAIAEYPVGLAHEWDRSPCAPFH
jgi:hypothetical protein